MSVLGGTVPCGGTATRPGLPPVNITIDPRPFWNPGVLSGSSKYRTSRTDSKQPHARPYVNSTCDRVSARRHEDDALTRGVPGRFIDRVLNGTPVITGNDHRNGIVRLRGENRSGRSRNADPEQAKESHEHFSCISEAGSEDTALARYLPALYVLGLTFQSKRQPSLISSGAAPAGRPMTSVGC